MGLSIRAVSEGYPRLETARLVLRAFELTDASRVQLLAGDRAVAATTARIPHPYPDGEAERWIATHAIAFAEERGLNLAIVHRADGLLVGSIGLEIQPWHARAEVGYWIGREYWGQGYATEALRAVLAYGFGRGLRRIWAEHFATNPASGRVLQKAGMRHEGTLRQHMLKWSEPMDCEVYGLLAEEFRRG